MQWTGLGGVRHNRCGVDVRSATVLALFSEYSSAWPSGVIESCDRQDGGRRKTEALGHGEVGGKLVLENEHVDRKQ
jgi:hypothetical protein